MDQPLLRRFNDMQQTAAQMQRRVTPGAPSTASVQQPATGCLNDAAAKGKSPGTAMHIEVISRIPSSKFVRAKVMLSRLVKFRKGDSPYEDLDGDDKVEMDITDLYSSGSRPVSSSYGDSSGATNRARLSLGGEMSDLASLGSKDTEETFTVEQAIDQIGFGPFQIKLSVLTGFAWMADAMEMMILAILSPALHCSWQLTGLQEAAITTVVFCGMMSSSGLWGSICDKYGRKTELIMCSVVTFYFGILSAFSPSYVWLLILRGLVGFGIGGAPQALVCAFSYYGIVLLTTALFESPDGCHGTDVKFNPDPACFLECKTLTKDDYKDLTWTTLAEFPGLFLTAFLLEKIGRKYTMAIEFGIFSLFFYPTSMRAMGLGTCSGMARIGAIVTPFVAQVLLKVSAYVAISLYGVMCLIATVASLLLPYETKGREMKKLTHKHKHTFTWVVVFHNRSISNRYTDFSPTDVSPPDVSEPDVLPTGRFAAGRFEPDLLPTGVSP
ncbi:hypothetical protein C0Q70_07114 [Pomacea canaliculata]|uniref:Major facilitator superfamily (MFS) profile domain-containing protein n=1 Tax=Pomacea canaliculata TaxID=400727 RepID=A0A2T7PE49_POMCA|nr:hypothetical protein C0Q70_07114 [Pomacea canaliculata]